MPILSATFAQGRQRGIDKAGKATGRDSEKPQKGKKGTPPPPPTISEPFEGYCDNCRKSGAHQDELPPVVAVTGSARDRGTRQRQG